MSLSLTKLIAVLLVSLQATVGVITPGRVLCLPVTDCEHQEFAAAACDGGGELDSDCEHHAVVGLTPDHQNECGCHLHVPIPGDPKTPGQPQARGDTQQSRAVLPVAILTVGWGLPNAVPVGLAHGHYAADRCLSAASLALKTTRLRI